METKTSSEKSAGFQLDPEVLGTWMDREGIAGEGEEIALDRLAGGSQNELYKITRGSEQFVLRTPGSGSGKDRFDGLRRELTLLRALKGADVPHAEFVAGDEGGEILGAPFYLMEVVDGWSPTAGWPEPYESDPSLRGPLAFGLIEGAAKLARVDWEACGLQGFGRPENFHDRQVDRWLNFLSKYKFREIPGIDQASEWLRNNKPHQWSPGIMHGDYQFANVMFTNDTPPGLAAVIDWEMTTIGDPLLDLGWALMSYGPEAEDMNHYVSLEGMPPRDELLEHYENISGRSTEALDYYLVLARWKLSIVLEMSFARLKSGGPVDPKVESFGTIVLDLMRKAAELSRTTSFKGRA